MNPDASSPDSPQRSFVPEEASSVAWTTDGEFSDPFNWRQWLRRLLVCNPFFLLSAALLLFGLNRLSVDPNFLQREEAKLLFNFGALQGYEILVVGTALVLARRRIWYDSSLLVVVEQGLLLVPFLFITQAALIDRRLASALSVVAALLALARMAAVRRWFPRFNLPRGLVGLGALVLAANLALVFVSRHVMETTFENWQRPNELVWALLLPLLVAGANLLPKPVAHGGAEPERPWLPLLIALLWMAGTAVHVWCVAWICKLPLEARHLAPALWVAAWTAFLRLGDCTATPSRFGKQMLLGLAAALPLLALARPGLCALLMGFNGVALLAMAWKDADIRRLSQHLAVASFSGMVACIVPGWTPVWFGPRLSTAEVPMIGIGLYLVASALWRSHPGFGVAAALMVAVGVENLGLASSAHGVVQTALLVLVAHSLRWNDADSAGAIWLRRCALAGWWLNAVVWTRSAEWTPVGATCASAAVILLLWVLWTRRGHPVTKLVPVAALAVALTGPGNSLQQTGSTGLLAVLGSLGLFAAGFVFAMKRPARAASTAGEAAPTESVS